MRFSFHKYFTMFFLFFFKYFNLSFFLHFFDPHPHPRPSTHDPRPTTFSYTPHKLAIYETECGEIWETKSACLSGLFSLEAGEQTDHYLERREEGLSIWRKAFFKFYWPSSLWSAFHFFLFSSHLIRSLWLFLRSEVVLFPNFTNCWRGENLLLNQGKSSRLVNQVFVLVTGHFGVARFWHRTLIFRFGAVRSG